MSYYIEPQDSNGEPINNKKVKVWYVMLDGAIVAKSESLDIAKRMVDYLELRDLDIKAKKITESEIEAIFYKEDLETHVYSAILQIFMMSESEWCDTPNKAVQAVKRKSEIKTPPIRDGKF